jgi:hypothetical protein
MGIPESIISEEPGSVAFRRILLRKLAERGHEGDPEAEADRLIARGIPKFRWPQDLVEGRE